jgi:nicotinate-nucleotide pyrophosphorylase (carboxylating)
MALFVLKGIYMLKWDDVIDVIDRALAEDVRDGDVTTVWTIPATKLARAEFIARADGVVAGLDVAKWVFERVDDTIVFDVLMSDGDVIKPGDVMAVVSGSARGLLTAERTALNFMQRMSGIATMTAAFVKQVEGTTARILDTRKTAPGMRALDKYAVTAGGGKNHRIGLFDMVLLKENHIEAADGIGPAVMAVRKGMAVEGRSVKIEVEVENLGELEDVLTLDVDQVMLDNMSLDEMKEAVERVARLDGNRPALEASGDVSMETVRGIAETGVDYISVGALTHSVKAMNISMLFQ